jgi:hypothetical protein
MKSHGKAVSLLMSVCFIVATATAAFAQNGKCSFQQLNFPPPATNGNAVALNDLGGIAGDFLDSKNASHGFLLYQGRLTTFMFPGSIFTTVSDMSRNGIIIGQYNVAGDPKQHAFMVHSGGFRTIILPGFPNADVTVAGVNANGDIVGEFSDTTVTGAPGFLLHNGKLTILSVPVFGAVATVPTSINDEGVVVGNYFSDTVNSNPSFIWKDGVFSDIQLSDSVFPPFMNAAKISNSGVVVGNYAAVADDRFPGYALKNGTSIKIFVPGSQETDILAVNKFDNVLARVVQSTQQGGKTVLVKGFCSAAF